MDIKKEREAFEAWLKSLNENGRKTYFLGQESTVAWEAWQAAAQVPEGFVLVPKEKLSVFWQDDDEPENIVSDESDFNSLGDCIDLGDVMTIKKHTQANIETETLYGTWFAEVINPSEKANFFVGTNEECLDIVKKNKAMIEAAQGEEE